ncbi:Cg6 protein [Plasmodium reichenowi]|uniref:Cg6 protein n=1 Tax=Plasmodium reichenowi TaxID=5854 RepID=A0A151LMN6_PLARE|nr:Cg6 protein [Plasmodium reichenowi]KYO00416.1 Cg6 protein [Plasmodium reichenowi]
MNKYIRAPKLIYICASLGIHSILFKKEKSSDNKNLYHNKDFIKLKNIIFLTSCEIPQDPKEEGGKKNYDRYHNELFNNKINQNNVHIDNNELINYFDELYKESKNENIITNGEEEEVEFNSSNVLLSFVEEHEHVKNKNDNDKCIKDEHGESERVEENIILSEDIINIIENILKKYNVVLFMKGTALNPYCKYSKQAIHILKLNKVKQIHTVNILDNQELRNALKIYSNWPTFPQLYVNHKFIGGIDKLQELHDQNKIKDII